MAVIKAANSGNTLGGILDYVTKKEKTEAKLLSGINCSPDTVKEEMEFTKELWDKTDGRQYKHFVQSFAPGENVSPETAHDLGCKLAEEVEAWKGFEVLIATHQDKEHIHTHFIINSVNVDDGHKLQWRKKDLQDMKDASDNLCREYGLSICEKGKSFDGSERKDVLTSYDKDVYNFLLKAEGENSKVSSYVRNIALAVLEVKEDASSKEDFAMRMYALGYRTEWTDTRKYITFTDIEREEAGEKKCKVRNNKLQEYYGIDLSKEALERGFAEVLNRQLEPSAEIGIEDPKPAEVIEPVIETAEEPVKPAEKPSEPIKQAEELVIDKEPVQAVEELVTAPADPLEEIMPEAYKLLDVFYAETLYVEDKRKPADAAVIGAPGKLQELWDMLEDKLKECNEAWKAVPQTKWYSSRKEKDAEAAAKSFAKEKRSEAEYIFQQMVSMGVREPYIGISDMEKVRMFTEDRIKRLKGEAYAEQEDARPDNMPIGSKKRRDVAEKAFRDYINNIPDEYKGAARDCLNAYAERFPRGGDVNYYTTLHVDSIINTLPKSAERLQREEEQRKAQEAQRAAKEAQRQYGKNGKEHVR